jgi:predicted DCC family thiol-disulfide oxidoreductase YuxK
MSRIEGKALVVFDGDCPFCARWVQLLIRYDRHDRLTFIRRKDISLLAGSLAFDAHKELPYDTISVIFRDAVFTKSAAVLLVLELVGMPRLFLHAAKLVPPKIRDYGYDFIARHRYKLAQRKTCRKYSEEEMRKLIQ